MTGGADAAFLLGGPRTRFCGRIRIRETLCVTPHPRDVLRPQRTPETRSPEWCDGRASVWPSVCLAERFPEQRDPGPRVRPTLRAQNRLWGPRAEESRAGNIPGQVAREDTRRPRTLVWKGTHGTEYGDPVSALPGPDSEGAASVKTGVGPRHGQEGGGLSSQMPGREGLPQAVSELYPRDRSPEDSVRWQGDGWGLGAQGAAPAPPPAPG